MLHPFIIEQIRRREEDERRRNEQLRPRLELPVDVHRSPSEPCEDDEVAERGVAILDLG